MAELAGFRFPTKWLGLAGRAGRGVVLVGVGLEGSFGVLAGELLVREYFLDGEVPDLTRGLWLKSSSDFFLAVLLKGISKELLL